jgi:hypothetical protein
VLFVRPGGSTGEAFFIAPADNTSRHLVSGALDPEPAHQGDGIHPPVSSLFVFSWLCAEEFE